MYLKTESILPIQSIPNTAQQSLYAPLDIKHQEMLISADNDVNIRNDSAIQNRLYIHYLEFFPQRTSVAVILDNLASGIMKEELLRDYPSLTSIDIDAALAYVALLARERHVVI